MLKRFLLYGCGGWLLEVGFTGLSSVIFQKDRSATAKTYLWMHPIYGAAGVVLELLAKRFRRMPTAARAALYLPVIYAAEYSTGWLLCRLLGKCPWDYGTKGMSVKGFIRLDYAPFWYMAALAFEPAAKQVSLIANPPRYPWSRPALGR